MEVLRNRKEWNSALGDEFVQEQDVYFRYEYFAIQQKHYGFEPEALRWSDENISVLWTHLVRDLATIDELKRFAPLRDVTTPYGYGGPLVHARTKDPSQVHRSMEAFYSDYMAYANEQHYVTEFIRFHPLIKNWRIFENIGPIEELSHTVVVDLTGGTTRAWEGLKKGRRYGVKKTRREGCTVEIVERPSREDVDDFMELYIRTMDRNKASRKYYFDRAFIEDHIRLLPSFLVMVRPSSGGPIGASLFIHDERFVHYHLAGSEIDKGVYPQDLMLWAAIEHSCDEGYEAMHLGGGRGTDDDLFHYKEGFSSRTEPFHIGKLVFDQNAYDELVRSVGGPEEGSFFPSYRAKITDGI